jgi:U3 small nucleolar RNA-associated protein 14
VRRRLIERAFANDNVVEAFEAEKAEEMEADEEGRKPKAEPVLPGWGAWAGEGVKAKPRAPKASEKVCVCGGGSVWGRRCAIRRAKADRPHRGQPHHGPRLADHGPM